MLYCIDIMKAIACLLIANFHSDILFPEKLSLLAFGGDVGNNIFFFVSGFVLLDGIKKTQWSQFGKWLKKRYLRILPLVLSIEVLYAIVLNEVDSIGRALEVFIFPTLYWFTGAIIIFYPLLFIVEKGGTKRKRYIIMCALIVAHLLYDTLFAERYFIGFLAMLVGSETKKYLKVNEDKVKNGSQIKWWLGLVLCGGIYLVLKLLRKQKIEMGGFIHLGIGICTIFVALNLLFALYAQEAKISKYLCDKTKIRWVIRTLSSITLSVYLVQGFADRIIVKAFLGMKFPISYILDIIIVLAIAFLITELDNYIHKIIRGKIEK